MFPIEFYVAIQPFYRILCYPTVSMIPWHTIGWNWSHDGWVFKWEMSNRRIGTFQHYLYESDGVLS